MSIKNKFNKIYLENKTMQAIQNAEELELDLIKSKRDEVFYNSFVFTSNEYGISRWEKIFKLKADPLVDSLEFRRNRVSDKLTAENKYTFPYLHKWLKDLVSDFEFEQDVFNFSFLIALPEQKFKYWQFVEDHVNIIKPANMIFNKIWKTNSNVKLVEKITSILTADFLSSRKLLGGKRIEKPMIYDGTWTYDGTRFFNGGEVEYTDWYLVSEFKQYEVAELAYFDGTWTYDGSMKYDGLKVKNE